MNFFSITPISAVGNKPINPSDTRGQKADRAAKPHRPRARNNPPHTSADGHLRKKTIVALMHAISAWTARYRTSAQTQPTTIRLTRMVRGATKKSNGGTKG